MVLFELHQSSLFQRIARFLYKFLFVNKTKFVQVLRIYAHMSKVNRFLETRWLIPYKCLRSLNTVKVNLSKYSRCSIEVLLFHESNTPEFSCKFSCLPLSHLKMLSYFEFQLATASLM